MPARYLLCRRCHPVPRVRTARHLAAHSETSPHPHPNPSPNPIPSPNPNPNSNPNPSPYPNPNPNLNPNANPYQVETADGDVGSNSPYGIDCEDGVVGALDANGTVTGVLPGTLVSYYLVVRNKSVTST